MREYVESLRRAGDLIEIDVPVEPRFELAAVTQRLQREGDQAILFHSVRGASMPVVTNVYGSRRRLCGIIGAEDGSFCRRWTELWPAAAGSQMPPTHVLSPAPSRVSGSLADLPWITYYEKDGGPYITSALFLARHPDTGVANLSFHRSQIISPGE